MDSQFLDFKIFPISSINSFINEGKGENQKQFLILYAESDEQEETLLFLAKILQAIEHNLLEDTFSIKMSNLSQIKFIDLQEKINCKTLLSFGIPPKQLGLLYSIQKYTKTDLLDTQFIFADTLQAISQDKQLKAALWQSLKSLR